MPFESLRRRGPMPARIRIVLAGVCALAVAGMLAALVAARVTDETGDPPPSATAFAGGIMPAGVPVPDFSLRDQDGARFSREDILGAPALITFVYSTCEESCGPQLQLIRGALDDVGYDIPVIAISADATTDTPERAQRFMVEQRMLGRARFLLGSAIELAPVYKGFFVQPQTPSQEHHARIVLVDRRGFQRVGYGLANSTSDDIAHDIALLQRRDRQ